MRSTAQQITISSVSPRSAPPPPPPRSPSRFRAELSRNTGSLPSAALAPTGATEFGRQRAVSKEEPCKPEYWHLPAERLRSSAQLSRADTILDAASRRRLPHRLRKPRPPKMRR